ncbi:MAG: prepilin-type N-terminal cleavage/methylation domain-containing protein [Candidatus Omnitrophota bacterium]
MDKRGFTFIEVLGAIVILAVALVPLMELAAESLVASRKSECTEVVAFLAQQKMDDLRVKTLNDFDTSRDESVTRFSLDPGLPFYNYKYTVADNEGIGIKEIQVNVWYDEDGDDAIDVREDDIRLDTKIADRP